jgi:glycosyltransferase involved in cell wall biosynthesis
MRHAYWLAHRIAASGSSHIHVHFGGPAAQWAMCASALNGVPYSFVAHRYEVYERPPPRFDTLVRRARFCVTVSQANVRQLNRMLGQLSSKFELIPNGTDTSFFCPDRNVPREPGLVVSVGRLSPQKAFQDLIEAAAIVRDRSSSFHMVIIGEGPERQRLEALIAARHLGSRVTLAGARDALFVRDRLRRAEVFALSSISESFGVVYLEAMATETPVVGTGVQGVPEVVAEGVTGFLVPPGAPEAMAERIAKLLGDPDLRGRMGRAGRQRVCKEFSITEQAVRLSGLLTTGPV